MLLGICVVELQCLGLFLGDLKGCAVTLDVWCLACVKYQF